MYRKQFGGLRLQPLEDRVTPSTFTVLNSADNGPGSLRQAVLDLNQAKPLVHFGGWHVS